MKKAVRFLPYILYIIALASFIIPSIYVKVDDKKITYNFLELTFGKDIFDLSIGLLLILILFLTTIVLSIATISKDNKLVTNMTIILGLASGVLTFFQRMLTNPNSTDYSAYVGLFLPGILIIIGTILLFINKKIIKG